MLASLLRWGATSLQICTEVMHKGYGIISELIKGLDTYLESKNMKSVNELRGKALEFYKNWEELDLNYKIIADIDQSRCSSCNKCYNACNDGAYQAIIPAKINDYPQIVEDKCVGCNLCYLVCPNDAISMKDVSKEATVKTWKDIVNHGTKISDDNVLE